jgi:hypothetical protein
MDRTAEMLIGTKRSAGTCRWGTPTLFLSAPFWFEAERCPWSCRRDPVPRALNATDGCATCLFWQPRDGVLPAASLHRERAGTVREGAVPLMVDWLGAVLPPHETE